MKELTKEQAIKYISQFITEFGYLSFDDLIQHQRHKLISYVNKMNMPSDASNTINLEIKLKNPPYRKLCIRIDFVNKSVELRNYKVYANDITVSFNELNNLDRIEKLNEIFTN